MDRVYGPATRDFSPQIVDPHTIRKLATTTVYPSLHH